MLRRTFLFALVAWAALSLTLPAQAAIALVSHTGFGAGATGGTSSSIDSTGANLLIVAVSNDAATGGVAVTVTDSKSNTWTALTSYNSNNSGDIHGVQIFYAKNPTVGTGHTFTVTAAASSFPAITVTTWSGCDTSAPFDKENGFADNLTTGNTVQPGSVTPSQANSLIVTQVWAGVPAVSSIDSSFTISDAVAFAGGTNYAGAQAYLLQGSASAVNPTWTLALAPTNGHAASIAVFKPAGASPATNPSSMPLQGVGH